MPYYGVRVGRDGPGVYASWDECKRVVEGVSGAVYKRFATAAEARVWVGEGGSTHEQGADALVDAHVAGRAVAYCDGSTTGDGSLISWAVVLYHGLHVAAEHAGVVELGHEARPLRNLAGELVAVLKALEICDGDLVIAHDYNGAAHWARGTWKTRHAWVRDTYIPRVREHLDRIEFVWIRGHKGIEGNERADRLAKEAITRHRQP